MKVKEAMKHAKTIGWDSSVRDAAKIMARDRIGSLVVVDERKIAGIVTKRDILSKVTAANKLPSKIQVNEIMSPDLVTISPESHIDDAVYLMLKHKIKKLPVIDEGELVGVITSTDIVTHSDEIGQFYFFG